MQTDDDKDQSSSVNGKRLVKEYLELFAHVNRHYLAIAQDRYPRPRLVCSKAFSLQPRTPSLGTFKLWQLSQRNNNKKQARLTAFKSGLTRVSRHRKCTTRIPLLASLQSLLLSLGLAPMLCLVEQHLSYTPILCTAHSI